MLLVHVMDATTLQRQFSQLVPASLSRPAKDKLPKGLPQDISDGGVALGNPHGNWANAKFCLWLLLK